MMAPDEWAQAASNVCLLLMPKLPCVDAQVHILYLLEVGLLPGVEVFLGTGGSGTGHQIDEAVGVGVYFADAGFAGFGGDEHDDTDVILRGDGFVTLFVIAEREVGMMTPSMPHSTHFWQKVSKPNCMMGLRYPIRTSGMRTSRRMSRNCSKSRRRDMPLCRARVAAF